jgi:hypothetical protein
VTTRQPSILDALNMEHALEFSYRCYHSEKLDYLCVFRSTHLTIKAYFFDEGSNDEVVVPHTHRYDFDTRVVRGSLAEARYSGDIDHGIEYTPLDYQHGRGFEVIGGCRSFLAHELKVYRAGQSYSNRAHEDIHTLLRVEPGTVLLLNQYQDKGRANTTAFSRKGRPLPTTTGLYERMTRGQVMARADQLQTALGGL